MRLLFTMGSGSASGHCNTMEIGSKPTQKTRSGEKKGRRSSKSGSSKRMDTFSPTSSMRTQSTLGSQETDLGMTTLGSRKFTETVEYNSLTYTQQVKKTFERNSAIYREFVQILSEVSNGSSDKVELVKRIIVLFDGYPELIRGFTYFLPPEITIEVQDDAVVVNVEDEGEDSDEDPFNNEEDTDMTRYIRNIKWTYMHQPEIYQRFSAILQGFNRKNISEMEAATQIANLFEGQRDLVLGFNIFLSDDFKILEHEKKGYLIRHPCKKGMRAHYTPINVTEEYVN